jgi:hypothetical protein
MSSGALLIFGSLAWMRAQRWSTVFPAKPGWYEVRRVMFRQIEVAAWEGRQGVMVNVSQDDQGRWWVWAAGPKWKFPLTDIVMAEWKGPRRLVGDDIDLSRS